VLFLAHDAVQETEDLVLKSLPVKKISLIFLVTFLLVFVIFTMVEPNFQCPEGNLQECRFLDISGNFVLGILISGVLFLFDMLMLYMTLSEYFM
jgi:hypothetical protein